MLAALAGPGELAVRGSAMLDEPAGRGEWRRATWRGDTAWLGVGRAAWQAGDAELAGAFAADGSCTVIADATLYYRDELRARLRAGGEETNSDAPAALILAAYRAWGEAAPGYLEGDFAFVLWDDRRRRLICARDFVGRRALHVALFDGVAAVATSPGAILTHPSCPRELDLATLATAAAGLLETGWGTAYQAVRAVPAGATMVIELDAAGAPGAPRIRRHWEAPTFEQRGPGFAAAVEELRATLQRATAERLDPAAPTAIWLSGGWDSTAVYGAGQAARRTAGSSAPASLRLAPVSMSYPPGDAGREDELIAAVLEHWGDATTWCAIADVPLFAADAAAAARRRALPLAHPYEQWTRVLARAARATGARVVLDGTGGDQLFQVSPVYLADLLRRGRLFAARREWRERGMTGSGWRRFVRYAVHPLLPAPALQLAAALRGGRALRGMRARAIAPWIRADFVQASGLEARMELELQRRAGERWSALESRWFFESSYSPTILAEQAGVTLDEGLELRSPLYDGRVVALAARRPREERSSGGETKRLLRAAASAWLPPATVAPRRSRTGVTTHYFRRAMERELPALASFVSDSSVLAALGVVEPAAFERAVQRYLRGDAEHDVALFQTVQTELWLRAHAAGGHADEVPAIAPAQVHGRRRRGEPPPLPAATVRASSSSSHSLIAPPMPETPLNPAPIPAPPAARPYETPALERFGTFRELTQAGGGGNCDPSLVLGPETGTGTNLARCYD